MSENSGLSDGMGICYTAQHVHEDTTFYLISCFLDVWNRLFVNLMHVKGNFSLAIWKFLALIFSSIIQLIKCAHRQPISSSLQVFTFGSVPLKTYLPDGDIDVTAFSNSEELKEIWANLVRDALEREEKSENAEFHVKEVQYIQAEVFFPEITII